jgi:DNA (cytosine-5)-methyltransferase 1
VSEPVSTVSAHARKGIASPFLICMEHRGSVRDVDRPMPTITTAKGGAIGVAEPFLVEPSGTIEHWRMSCNNGHDFYGPLEMLCPHCGEASTHTHGNPFLVQVAHEGGDRSRSVDKPLPTVAGNRGEFALLEPSLLPQQSDGRLRPVSEPVPTVSTDGAIALVEPFLVEYYGNGGAQSVDDPLNTVTVKDRHALVRPVVILNGERYQLDIRFRMLQPRELAAAQGFASDYIFAGNKTEQVKQIGNAVPRHLARAIVAAVLTQKEDVSWLENSTRPSTTETTMPKNAGTHRRKKR